MGAEGTRIAVIGAGFSGVMTAIHLLWRCRPGDRVYLVEKSGRLGPGLAFATHHPAHLLNVRTENMSAFADEPDHFVRWLKRQPEAYRAEAGERTLAGLFVRRRVYGDYVQDLLRSAITEQGGAQNLFIVADEAVALRRAGKLLDLETAGGRAYRLDAAVLALGNFPPARSAPRGYFSNPWDPAAVEGLRPNLPVLLVGSGLTMVDLTLALLDQGFAGPIIALSRRGVLPQGHAPSAPWPALALSAADRHSLATLMRAVRREVRRAAAQGVGWRAVVDALRPHSASLWQGLSPADRDRFLRHLRPWWDIHRHRTAPPVAATLEALRQNGTLRVRAGRVLAIEAAYGGQLIVRWRPRAADADRTTQVQRVIDCSGPGTDYRQLDQPLVRQLIEVGLVRPDPCRLGLETSQQSALVAADGTVAPDLLAVGPVTRGTFWETTSVPDIRAQAEEVAVAALEAARRARAA